MTERQTFPSCSSPTPGQDAPSGSVARRFPATGGRSSAFRGPRETGSGSANTRMMGRRTSKIIYLARGAIALLFFVASASVGSPAHAAPHTWTTSTFLQFSEGTLGDGGANSYITAVGEVRLINQWDLNRDGFVDIVLPNTHDNHEQQDLFIYWGIEQFEVERRTRLPSDGGHAHAIADLDGNGFLDLVVVNRSNGVRQDLDSYVYWGSAEGFDIKRRLGLPTLGASAAAVHDLNQDGNLDWFDLIGPANGERLLLRTLDRCHCGYVRACPERQTGIATRQARPGK